MGKRNPWFDEYIEKSADFAKPVMMHLRDMMHVACPDVEEAVKWSMPCFVYKGKILANMASFKQHMAFGFWHPEMRELESISKEGMGSLGKITGLADLPKDKVLIAYTKKAMALTDAGVKTTANRPAPRPKGEGAQDLEIPDDLAAALKGNKQAKAAFAKFNYSHKKEYVEWITEAKREETRRKRLETAIEWIAEGKSRHWKYNVRK
jgi:uncharacterized protein YdeI (YjbR/CyaY-like superfamily)